VGVIALFFMAAAATGLIPGVEPLDECCEDLMPTAL
jgi:hypothetical protein